MNERKYKIVPSMFLMPILMLMFVVYYLYTVKDAIWEVSIYPKVMGVGIIICLIVIAVQSFSKKSDKSIKDSDDRKLLMKFAFGIMFYLLVMYFFGFIAATIPYLLFNFYMLGYKNFRNSVVICLLFTFITYFLFTKFLFVELFKGIIVGKILGN